MAVVELNKENFESVVSGALLQGALEQVVERAKALDMDEVRRSIAESESPAA